MNFTSCTGEESGKAGNIVSSLSVSQIIQKALPFGSGFISDVSNLSKGYIIKHFIHSFLSFFLLKV